MNISLPADLRRWLDEQVREGGYGTASEYVRDVLRRRRERQVRQRVDALLLEAVQSGATEVMDDADWTAIRREARAGAEAMRRRGKRKCAA